MYLLLVAFKTMKFLGSTFNGKLVRKGERVQIKTGMMHLHAVAKTGNIPIHSLMSLNFKMFLLVSRPFSPSVGNIVNFSSRDTLNHLGIIIEINWRDCNNMCYSLEK